MRRRGLRVVLVLLVVLVAVLVGLDIGGRALAQRDLADRARSDGGARSASATIGGFPFLWDLLVDGDVPTAHVRLTDAYAGDHLRVQQLEVDLTGVHVDQKALVAHQDVRVRSIEAASASATVTAAELSAAAGLPVSLPGHDIILVQAYGRSVPATLTVDPGDVLVLDVVGRPVLRARLTASPLVPDCAMAVQVRVGSVTVSCHVAPVPAKVVQAVSSG